MVDGTNVKSGDLDGYMLPIGKVSAGSEVKVTFELKGETEDWLCAPFCGRLRSGGI